MTTKQWTGAGGTNNGALTVANSGGASGDAFDGPSPLALAGGLNTYSNLNPPFTGHMSSRLQAFTTGDRARCYHSYTAANQLSERWYFRLRSDPGTAQLLFAFIDNSGAFAQAGGITVATSGGVRHLRLVDRLGATLQDFGTLTYGTATTDIYRVDYNITMGTSATNGRVECSIFDSTNTLIAAAYLATNVNTGTVQLIRSQWGGNTNVPLDMDVWTIRGNNDSPPALIGAGSANVGPVATIMARPVSQGPGTVTVTGTITDADGTVNTAAMTIVSGPNNPTPSNSTTGLGTASCSVSATFTGVAGRYVVRLSGTDNSGLASNNSDVIIDVYASPTGVVRPYSVLSTTGTWTRVVAATDIEAVTDGLVTSYLETSAAPVGVQKVFQWCAFGPGGIVFNIAGYGNPASPTVTVTVDVYKEDNTTLVYTDNFVAPSADAITTVTLDSTALALVPVSGDQRRALITRISATQ